MSKPIFKKLLLALQAIAGLVIISAAIFVTGLLAKCIWKLFIAGFNLW